MHEVNTALRLEEVISLKKNPSVFVCPEVKLTDPLMRLPETGLMCVMEAKGG